MANRQEDCEQQGDTRCLAEARCVAKADQQSPAGRCGYCFVRPAPDGGNMGFDWQWEELTKRKVGELLGERLAKGRAQYGKLDPNKKQSREWLQELVEELLDGFVYAYMLATKLGMYQPDPPNGGKRPGLCPHTDADGMPGCRKCGIESGYVTRSTYLSALARAEAAEKRVAELEARAERIHDDALRAGIREGLERAAVKLETHWAASAEARDIRGMKDGVK